MDTIIEWKKEPERKNRHRLSNNQWENVILCLGSEGYSVKYIHEILTLGRGADQGIRDLWGLGLGNAPKWTATQDKQAYNVIWNFFKRDIEELYHGQTDSDGKVIVKGQSTVNIQRIIHENTGFKLPSQSMQNQMEKVWGFSMRKRPQKVELEDSLSPCIKAEGCHATVLSEGQDYQDWNDHKVKRDIRAELSISLSQQSNPQNEPSHLQSASDDLRLERLEHQISILTEDFQKALTIGYSQNITLKSFKKQLQKLDDEVALLRSDNSTLGIQNETLRKKNCFLEARVDKLLGFNQKLEANLGDLQNKTLQLQEEVNSLDALKMENQNLRTQKAILLKEHALLRHILHQLVTKIQLLPNSSEHTLKHEVEKLGHDYDCHKLRDDSPRISVDSGYYSNSLDLEIRQSLNMVPIRFQNAINVQGGALKSHLSDSDTKQRRHCKIIQLDIPMTLSNADSLPGLENVASKPSWTKPESADKTSLKNWRNDSLDGMQMSGSEDTQMTDCVLPAGPVFTAVDAGFGDQWNDPIMFNPPRQIPNFDHYNESDDGFNYYNQI